MQVERRGRRRMMRRRESIEHECEFLQCSHGHKPYAGNDKLVTVHQKKACVQREHVVRVT